MDKITKNLPYIIIFLTTFAAYGSAIFNGFALDDVIQVEHNRTLLLGDYGWTVLTTPVFPGNLYRPLTFVSYYFEHFLWGLNPLPYHFLNIALHALVAVLLFTLFKRALSISIALSAALIFSLHPVFVEVVANISGRAEILCALFILSGIGIALVENKESFLNKYRLPLLALCSFFAAASKESGLMMTALLCLVFWVSGPKSRKVSTLAIGASLVGAFVYLCARLLVLEGVLYSSLPIDVSDNPLAAFSPLSRIIQALSLQGLYLLKVFYPFPLSADYTDLISATDEPYSGANLVSVVSMIFLAALSLFSVLKRSYLGAGLSWFFIAFLLTSNILFPIGTIFAERLTYVPYIGILFSLAIILDRAPLRLLAHALVIVLILFELALTQKSIPHWLNNDALASYQEDVSPGSFRTQLLLARRDWDRGNIEAARNHLNKSISILPKNDEAYHLLGVIALEEQELSKAEEYFKQALLINPDYPPSLSLYGRLLLNQGKLGLSQQLAEQILRIDRTNPDGLLILLALAIKNSDTVRARNYQVQLDFLGYKSADFEALKKRLEK